MCSARLGARVTQLKAVCMLITDIGARIRYSANDLPSILRELSVMERYTCLSFLKELAAGCDKGIPLSDIMRTVIGRDKTKRKSGSLNAEDMELISSFTEKLGASNVSGQLDHCKLYKQLAQQGLAEAEQEYKEKGKLYCLLGVFAGLSIMIFLI